MAISIHSQRAKGMGHRLLPDMSPQGNHETDSASRRTLQRPAWQHTG